MKLCRGLFFERFQSQTVYREILSGLSLSEWDQPKYWDAVAMAINSLAHHNKQFDWGFPVGVKQSADFNLCPALTVPDGGDSYECNASTCMLICQPGSSFFNKNFQSKFVSLSMEHMTNSI